MHEWRLEREADNTVWNTIGFIEVKIYLKSSNERQKFNSEDDEHRAFILCDLTMSFNIKTQGKPFEPVNESLNTRGRNERSSARTRPIASDFTLTHLWRQRRQQHHHHHQHKMCTHCLFVCLSRSKRIAFMGACVCAIRFNKTIISDYHFREKFFAVSLSHARSRSVRFFLISFGK